MTCRLKYCKRKPEGGKKTCEYHLEQGRAAHKRNHEKHRDKNNARCREYFNNNKEYFVSKRKAYYDSHKDQENAQCREYARKHDGEIRLRRHLTRERSRITNALWYRRTRKARAEYAKRYAALNPEKLKEGRERQKRRKTNAGQDAYLKSFLKGETIVRKLDFAV